MSFNIKTTTPIPLVPCANCNAHCYCNQGSSRQARDAHPVLQRRHHHPLGPPRAPRRLLPRRRVHDLRYRLESPRGCRGLDEQPRAARFLHRPRGGTDPPVTPRPGRDGGSELRERPQPRRAPHGIRGGHPRGVPVARGSEAARVRVGHRRRDRLDVEARDVRAVPSRGVEAVPAQHHLPRRQVVDREEPPDEEVGVVRREPGADPRHVGARVEVHPFPDRRVDLGALRTRPVNISAREERRRRDRVVAADAAEQRRVA
mmetsp:Transcript_11630/g.26530  ORF Transcript_11630/g.26530 Transcript_11630/m.26530 type:complete len:259 (-) Transcript_11630:580-1356(-)